MRSSYPDSVNAGALARSLSLGIAPMLLFTGVAAAQPKSIQLQNTSAATYGALRVMDHPDLQPQQFTLEARIRPDGPGFQGSDQAGCHVVTKFVEGEGTIFASGYALRWSPTTGKVNLAIAHQFDGSGIILSSNSTVPVGTIARISATFDGTTAKLYLNGVLDAQVESGFSSIFYAPADLRFGAGNGPPGFARRFQGLIDDVRIWNRPLAAEEIAAGGTCEAAGTEPGLVGAWPFTRRVYQDVTGHNHHALAEGAFGNVAEVPQPSGWSSPVFFDQPDRSFVCRGGSGGLYVLPVGTEPFSFQWQYTDAAGWHDIPEDADIVLNAGTPTPQFVGHSHGSTTDTIYVNGIQVRNHPRSATFRCTIGNVCGTATTVPLDLIICLADFNCDGYLNTQDFFDFLSAFFASDPAGDFNRDGLVNSQDYFDYLSEFFGGCHF